MNQDADKMIWTAADVVAAAGGELVCGDPEKRFSKIAIDSRTLAEGDAFVAIVGETHDGHEFVPDVVKQGGKGLILEKGKIASFPLEDWRKQGVVCVLVPDGRRALGDMAAYHRKRCRASVLALTGSNGKTTTKEMTARVISQKFSVLSNAGNLNNDVGVPLTLFNLDLSHAWAVIEAGMNHFGEIRRLSEICAPDVGLITNIGPAHLEGVGSLDGVLKAKAELFEGMTPDGAAVLNADDPRLRDLAGRLPQQRVLYGVSPDADVRASEVRATDEGVAFLLETPAGHAEIRLATPGRFMISNALAAAAAGWRIGLRPAEIKAGLEAFVPVKGRLNLIETQEGVHIIDDTYNANPGSTAAAIETLNALRKGRPGVLVMGDMLELGDRAAELHKGMGAAAAGLDRLYVTGRFAEDVARGAVENGMPATATVIGTHEDILREMAHGVRPGDWVLIKGSRAMGMERIVRGLQERTPVTPGHHRTGRRA